MFHGDTIIKANADVLAIPAVGTFRTKDVLRPSKSDLERGNLSAKQHQAYIAGRLVHGSSPFATNPAKAATFFQRVHGCVETFEQIPIHLHRDMSGLVPKGKKIGRRNGYGRGGVLCT